MRQPLLVVALVGLATGEVLAQEVAPPPALELPQGARVRVRTQTSPDGWIQGILASADSGTIALVPVEAPPLGANRLRLPSDTVTRLEVVTGRKRQWLPGLLVGAAAGAAMGFDMDVDPVQCQVNQNYFCSRASAVAAMAGTSAVIGAIVGGLVKKDVWTPVALDALGPPPARGPQASLGLRPVRGGVAARLFVSF